jgi:carbonic anhydrase
MQRLLEGYARFRSNVFPQHSTLFASLAKGQRPHALFITCSDSRVMPEMIMQCEPGDLFPCRNAGNLVPPAKETTSGVAATIEYAVRVLKVPDIVICGHSDCGAMKGLLQNEHLGELPMVRSWLEHAGPSSRWLRAMMENSTNWPMERKLQMLTEANVIVQMQNLATHPAVAQGLKAGTVQVHGWMFDIAKGCLRGFDLEQGTFTELIVDGPVAVSESIETKTELRIA